MKRLVLIGLWVLVTAGSAISADWWHSVKLKGDFRFRHEMNDREGGDAQHRQRIRARIGLYGTVSKYMKVGVQLASGSDDPVSTNQTLGSAFTTKSFGLDLAYMEATHPCLPGFTATAGKFKNPFYKPGGSELIWDSDYNPEGGVVTYARDVENVTVKLLTAGLWIVERGTGADSWMGAAQGTATLGLNDHTTAVTAGAAFFGYANTQGYSAFYDEDFFGNSFNTVMDVDGVDTMFSDLYALDYDLVEVYGEVSHHFSEQLPVKVMVDFVTNTAADSVNQGWLLGLHVGITKRPGSWALRYIYREVEKDAVLGTFTDSDFRGGGTDGKGHEIGGSVQFAENSTFSVSWFDNTIGLNTSDKGDFQRLQVDLQLKF